MQQPILASYIFSMSQRWNRVTGSANLAESGWVSGSEVNKYQSHKAKVKHMIFKAKHKAKYKRNKAKANHKYKSKHLTNGKFVALGDNVHCNIHHNARTTSLNCPKQFSSSNKYLCLYIQEYRTPLSPRRPLIGLSRDFTREHGSSRA